MSSYNRTTALTLGVFLILWWNNLHTQPHTKFLPVLSSYNRTIALTLAVFLILWWHPEKGKQSASTPTCRLYGAMTAMSCGASPACTSCSTWAATMSASPVNTHSVTVARPPRCLPLLSTHTALQWQGPHNVCLSCQHTQRYSGQAPTMSASPVNTHSGTVARPPQCRPLLSTHTALRWPGRHNVGLSCQHTQRYGGKAPTMSASPVNTHSVTVARPPQCLPLLSTHTALRWQGPHNVCLSCQHTQRYGGKAPTMSASPVNTHSVTVARPPQCLPLLSTHTALRWQGPHNVCLSCQHTQRYGGKAPTMSASPVNTHSVTVARPPQCLPLLSTHTALRWQGPHNVCLSCQHTQRYGGKAPTMSASPVNTHSVMVARPPQCLPLLSTHTALRWQGPHNVCLSCQHTQRYSGKAPTMSASPVNTHSVTVARPPQCLPLLSTHTALQWQGPHNVCLSCQHTQRYSGKAPTMSASPVNTHSVTVARPPQCLPLLSTHRAVQWQGPHNVCLSCQHTERYSGKAPTMSASPVNTHSGTVTRPPQCLPLLSTHTALQWQGPHNVCLSCQHTQLYSGKLNQRPNWETTWWQSTLMTVHPVERLPDKRPPWWQTTLMKYYLSLTWWGTNLTKDHPDERLPKYTLVRDHPDKRPHWWETTLMSLPWWKITWIYPGDGSSWQKTTLMRDLPDERPSTKDHLELRTLTKDDPDEGPSWWDAILINNHPNERSPWRQSITLPSLLCLKPSTSYFCVSEA